MLKTLGINEIDDAAELTWRLCSSPAARSYPLFQSLSEIKAEYCSRIDEKCSNLIGYYKNERLIGVLCYFYNPKELYLQTTSLAAAEDYNIVIDSFFSYISKNHAGYDVYAGVTAENIQVINSLQAFGYWQVEASSDMRLSKCNFIRQDISDNIVERVDRAHFYEYSEFHGTHFDNIYWNAERLREKLDDWYIFVSKEDGEIAGGLFMMTYENAAEIFGMAMNNASEKYKAVTLLSKAIDVVFNEKSDIKNVIFFVDDKDNINLYAALECNFEVQGKYRCYTAKV